MTMLRDTSETGLGGPGMWDPMPLTPPTSPPSQAKEPEYIWSRPDVVEPPDEAAAAKKKAAKKKPTKKKTTKKKTTKKKTARRAKKRR
jgi:hypothetical protein